jgi:hypothetical protein
MHDAHELQRAESPVFVPASRPRLGFLGVGWIGQHRLQALVRSGLVDVAAIVDPIQALAEQATSIAPGATVLSGMTALLAQELDGIVIATPSALHAEQTLVALTAGLAVWPRSRRRPLSAAQPHPTTSLVGISCHCHKP